MFLEVSTKPTYPQECNDSTNDWQVGALDNHYVASDTVYVKMYVHAIENFFFELPWKQQIGETKIGGTYLPRNTVSKIVYTNMSETTSSDKHLTYQVDYLY